LSEAQEISGPASEALELCRRELAQVRGDQEPLLEELAEVRHQLETTRNRLQALSREANTGLHGLPVGTGLLTRARRWATRRLRSRTPEWRAAERLRGSTEFNGPWALRRHPEAAASGLPPAIHDLRHGAAAGFDPGPGFSTSRYLAEHPDVARAGVNPLLHHLDSAAKGGR
jgi:hypothetical protein